MSQALLHYRGRVAALTRSRPADDPDLIDARRGLATEHLADHIARTLGQAPDLTAEQRARLSQLLYSTAGVAA